MRITFDEEADVMYIYFLEPTEEQGVVKRTVEVEEGILLDFGKDDRLFGIEIINVSERIPIRSLRSFSIDLAEKEAV